MNNNNILVIGIAGGTGSGKSTLTKQLVNHFGDQITVLKHDDYYKAHDEMTYEERTHLNYDHPNAFDTELMLQHLRQLKEGEPINCPIYDYTVHNRSRNFQVIYPTNVIVVEGILIFENKELCKEMDIKIFVDTDADIRIIRRIQRDVIERARSLESVISQYNVFDNLTKYSTWALLIFFCCCSYCWIVLNGTPDNSDSSLWLIPAYFRNIFRLVPFFAFMYNSFILSEN